MKLKSKLIATIVSICAAIAVMGVGVWAATSSFTVTVSNTVNLAFQSLDGSVKAVAVAGADDYKTENVEALGETILYSAGVETYNAIATEGTGTTLAWDGASFLTDTYLTQNTKQAAVAYTFTYTPSANAKSGATQITVTESSAPAVTGATIATSYYVRVGGAGNWYKLTSATAVTPADYNEVVEVMAICQYSNPNGTSVTTKTTAWNFNVVFTSVAGTATDVAGTATIATDNLADTGVVAVGTAA